MCPREGHQLPAVWWVEPAQVFAEGGVSRHHHGPGLQPEQSTARGKEALPLPPSTTTLTWASSLGGIYQLREWGLHHPFGGAHATPRQTLHWFEMGWPGLD